MLVLLIFGEFYTEFASLVKVLLLLLVLVYLVLSEYKELLEYCGLDLEDRVMVQKDMKLQQWVQ